MVGPTSNENNTEGGREPSGPDANGQAAMLLVESLIHGLVARSLITVEDAVDIVEDAADVREDIARENGAPPGVEEKSLTILNAIRASLSIDLPRDEVRPWPPAKGSPDQS